MKQILVVDDNLSILKQVSAHLADTYEVSLAKSGSLALQICAREKPDMILLDIEMSEMDGFDVLVLLKQNPILERIPVIFLTANRDAATEVKALALGAQDFIVKPVERSILLYRIEMHLRYASCRINTGETVMAFSDSIASSIAELIECRDTNTGGHIARAAKYVELVGTELIKSGTFADELNAGELQTIVRASALHDIGKIAVSDRILLKAGRLDDEEFSVMKRHAAIGAEILERMHRRMPNQHYLRYASLIARCHHERWDGKGYPQGLKGDDIPLCGRLAAVADVYDALMDTQVYRNGIGHAEACGIISSGKGTQFDPRIVDAFERIEDMLPNSLRACSNCGFL